MNKTLVLLLAIVSFLACGRRAPQTAPGQLQPGSAEYLANEGIGYLNNGRLELAAERLTAALKKNPQLAQALNAMALVHVYRREFPKAIEMLNRLLQVNPKFLDAFNLLGAVYTEQGDYEQAKENLLIAANAEEYQTPENAYANLAMLEIKFAKYDSALRYAEKGLLLNRRFAPLFNLKGQALENLNRLPEAAEGYARALALLASPEPVYLVNSARVAAKLGDRKRALDQLEQALGRTQDPDLRAEIIRMIKSL
jgi:type IV pilus assembly protein PilF